MSSITEREQKINPEMCQTSNHQYQYINIKHDHLSHVHLNNK